MNELQMLYCTKIAKIVNKKTLISFKMRFTSYHSSKTDNIKRSALVTDLASQHKYQIPETDNVLQ